MSLRTKTHLSFPFQLIFFSVAIIAKKLNHRSNIEHVRHHQFLLSVNNEKKMKIEMPPGPAELDVEGALYKCLAK